ncbi:hypothetical protein TEQG_07663 [Trichophyton equinum CBS 127.97]|uniref:Uncharacterized protein n=1 Tax=Trichophyton equinum (strain ATCC MYA-4606 / CBS 127.97) TaxID=559882 RepID=F2Q3I6_TRIEC|nr:hypothetical protein TEQG_07663 [Trichophyton equinum CBS 127.97]
MSPEVRKLSEEQDHHWKFSVTELKYGGNTANILKASLSQIQSITSKVFKLPSQLAFTRACGFSPNR